MLFFFAVAVRAVLVIAGAMLVARFGVGLREMVFSENPRVFGGGALM